MKNHTCIYIYIYHLIFVSKKKAVPILNLYIYLCSYVFSIVVFLKERYPFVWDIFLSWIAGGCCKKEVHRSYMIRQIMYPPALQQNNMTMPLKMYFLLNMGMLHCHVSFRGCIYDEKWIITPFVWWIIWRYITFSIYDHMSYMKAVYLVYLYVYMNILFAVDISIQFLCMRMHRYIVYIYMVYMLY